MDLSNDTPLANLSQLVTVLAFVFLNLGAVDNKLKLIFLPSYNSLYN